MGEVRIDREVSKLKEEEVWKILDILYEENEEAVKRWIYHKWPHGIGLYD